MMPLHTFSLLLHSQTRTPLAHEHEHAQHRVTICPMCILDVCVHFRCKMRLTSVLACLSCSPSALHIASWTFTKSGCECNSILHSPPGSHNNPLWHIIITLVRSSGCVATANAPCAPKCAHVYEREQLKARKNAWKRVQASVKAQE